MSTQPHSQMMSPTVARPADLPQAGARLAASALQHLPLPLAQGLQLHQLLLHLGRTQTNQAAQVAIGLPLLAGNAQALREGWDFGLALLAQSQALQAQWLEGLAELAQESGEIRRANTVSKYMDQQINLLEQGLALCKGQASSGVRLLENLQVSLAWWIQQRLSTDAAADAPAAAD